jgi:hypothetical protein
MTHPSSGSSPAPLKEMEPLQLPKGFNPGIIRPLQRRKLLLALFYSLLLPGLAHLYTDQKRVAFFFFTLLLLLALCAFFSPLPQVYLLYAWGIIELFAFFHTIRSVKTYLFRKRYQYLAGVHAWEYRSW